MSLLVCVGNNYTDLNTNDNTLRENNLIIFTSNLRARFFKSKKTLQEEGKGSVILLLCGRQYLCLCWAVDVAIPGIPKLDFAIKGYTITRTYIIQGSRAGTKQLVTTLGCH